MWYVHVVGANENSGKALVFESPNPAGAGNININANIELASISSTTLTFQAKGGIGGSGNISNVGSVMFDNRGTVDGDLITTENITYSGVISGEGSFEKQGLGSLILSGNNTYTGSTTLSAGTISITGINASTALSVASGSVLTVTGSLSDSASVSVAGTYNANATDTIGSLSGAGSIVLGSGLTVGDGSDTTVSGVISGAGSLTKQGDGTLTLSGENTYQGETVVNAGTLTITNDLGLGSADGATTVNSGGTLDLSSVDVAGEFDA